MGTEETNFYPPDAGGSFAFTGVRIVTGGSGRFAGAHGTLTTSATGSTESSTTRQYHTGRLWL